MGPWFVRAPLLLLSMLGLIERRLAAGAGAVAGPSPLSSPGASSSNGPCPTTTSTCSRTGVSASRSALQFTDPARQLARTSRLLLGLVFAFAVLWKAVLSPDYRDGRFFAVTLLTDDRFSEIVQLAGGLTDAQLRENREYLTPLPGGAELLEPPVLHTPRRFRWLVAVATWGTLAIEALAAVLWLAPLTRRGLLVARHCCGPGSSA